MEGTNFKKITRLINNLFQNPNHISKYLKYSIFNSKEPLETGLPWISFSAIDFLDNYGLTANHKILELGGGGSTIFFATKGAKVICLESSDVWINKISQKLNLSKLENIDIKYFPYDADNKSNFLSSDFYNYIKEETFDLIFIDNYEEDIQLRPICFYAAEKSIRKGGMIVIDDSWRYLEIRDHNSSKDQITFISTGPCRYGVTTTDIYFY